MVDYNMIYFWTLTFPLATIAGIAMAGYLIMRERYIRYRLRHDKRFRESVKGQSWIKKMKKKDKWRDNFRYKELDLAEIDEIEEGY